MKITKHVSFYFIRDRILYVNNILDETNKYAYTTDIFIHTNNADLHLFSFKTLILFMKNIIINYINTTR